MNLSQKEYIIQTMKQLSAKAQYENGFSTQSLSEIMGISRANLSRQLNSLVKEGVLKKEIGRPVLFKMRSHEDEKNLGFNNLIGFDGSLQNSIKLAKAAIMYPQHTLSTVVYGEIGAGKAFFIKSMINYAILNQKIETDYKKVEVDCGQISEIDVFENEEACDILIVRNLTKLSSSKQKQLVNVLENTFPNAMRIFVLNKNQIQKFENSSGTLIPIHIEIQSYKEKSFAEKLNLLEYLFTLESISMKKDIHLSADILYALLLCDPKENIKELKVDIKNACAKAYVRNINDQSSSISLTFEDFSNHIRRSIVNYKNYRIELHALIAKSSKLVFSQGEISQALNEKKHEPSIYDKTDSLVQKLKDQGMSEEETEAYVTADLLDSYQEYRLELMSKSENIEKLSKVVSRNLIKIVVEFIRNLSEITNSYYDERMIYSLCLHIHNHLINRQDHQTTGPWSYVKETQMTELKKRMALEYKEVLQLGETLEKEFSLTLTNQDILDLMFLLNEKYDSEMYNKQPALLIVMHGNAVAQSMSEIINDLTKSNISFGFDLPLESVPMDFYEQLKSMVLNIDQGAGVVVLYDMGSIKTMVEMITQEVDTKVSSIQLPATLQALDIARKCLNGIDLKKIKIADVKEDITDINYISRDLTRSHERIIVTLCKSGQGSAKHMKWYIEEVIHDEPIRVIDIAVENQEAFLNELNEIRKHNNITAIVGTFEPTIYPYIPFVGVSKLFELERKKLKTLLRVDTPDVFSQEGFYENIAENLVATDIDDIRRWIPSLVSNLALLTDDGFTTDQYVGLFIHIAFNIDRLRQGIVQIMKDSVARVDFDHKVYKSVSDAFKVIEKKFDIIFSDKEISLMIDYMLKR